MSAPRNPTAPVLSLALIAALGVNDVGAYSDEDTVFRDRSSETGLDFRHFNGMVGKFYFPEMTGQGGGLLDFDGDGDLDVILRQGAPLASGDTPAQSLFPIREPLGDRVFRNDLGTGRDPRAVAFVDVSASAGFLDTGYGMGLAAGDYDQDGDLDLYLTNYGPNQFWRNRGDGSFENVTGATRVEGPKWSTSAAFVDIDDDGNLDLFFTNYVEFDVDKNPRCFASTSARDYCGPSGFVSESDQLWRNLGDGTFENISSKSGIGQVRGAGLGVISGDFNGDGRVDLYVANDGEANNMWLNRGDGTFSDDALFSGTALNRRGAPEASMGLAAADFDGDGNEDLFLTHLAQESNTFYRSLGEALFEDRSRESLLAAPSMPYTSFGVVPVDFDNDSWPDLAIANGAVRIDLHLAATGDKYPLEQPNQLFRNRGNGSFEELSDVSGFSSTDVSRGLSSGDIDQDGAVDLIVFNNNGLARLLSNDAAVGSRWLGVAGTESNDLVRVLTKSGRTIHRTARSDGSYCSVSDARVVVGLEKEQPRQLEIERGRKRLRILDPPPDVYLVLPPTPRHAS